jgi:hypothetical protein
VDSSLFRFLVDNGVAIAAFGVLLGYFIQTQKQLVKNMLDELKSDREEGRYDRRALMETLSNNTVAWRENAKALDELKTAVHQMNNEHQNPTSVPTPKVPARRARRS